MKYSYKVALAHQEKVELTSRINPRAIQDAVQVGYAKAVEVLRTQEAMESPCITSADFANYLEGLESI